MSYLKRLTEITPGMLLLLIVLSLASRMITGLKIKTLTRLFNIDLPFKEWYGTAVIINFYNYFISKSGTAIGGAYLKKKHGLNYSRYVSALMGDVMVMFIAGGILGFSVYYYGFYVKMFDSWVAALAFLFLACVMIGMVFLPEIKLPEKGILIKVNKVLEGWNLLRKDKVLVAKLFFLNIGVMVASAARYYILFHLFADRVPIFICLLIAPLNVMAQILSVIPSAYGVREGITGAVTKLADFGFVPGAMVALIDRVIMMLVGFAQGAIFSFLLIKKSDISREEEPI